MVEAGWYDDPLIPGGKRYWDGAQWTEHAQAPPTGQGTGPGYGPPQGGPPPFEAGAVYGQAVAGTYQGPGINDIGEWIRRSFKITFQQIVPLAVLVGLQAGITIIAYLLFHAAVVDLVITDDGDFFGLNGGLLGLAALAAVAAGLVGLATHLATHHNLYGAHVGQAPTAGQSLGVGFARLVRFIGISLLLVVAIYAAILVLVGLVIGVAFLLGENAVGLVILFGVLAYVGLIVFIFWISVKLTFVTVSTAVVPRGTSAIRAAWDATSGFFWPILGRQLLMGLIVGALFMVPYVIAIFTVPALLFSRFEVLPNGDLAIDGQSIDSLNALVAQDFLPNPIATAVLIGVVSFLFSIIQAISYSATTALYADLNGPNNFGHGAR